MAGRGTDILLGGNPEAMARDILMKQGKDPDREEFKADWERDAGRSAKPQCAEDHDEVVALGGLHIVGTERHDSRRIDNQLRGRAGRQGDPGSSRFFLSLQDDLLRIFGGERMQNLMLRLGMEEDVPIESGLITKRIAAAQKAVEAQNFEVAQTPARIRRRDEQAAPGRLRHAPRIARGRRTERARDGDDARRDRQHASISAAPRMRIRTTGIWRPSDRYADAASASRMNPADLAG